MAIGVGARSCRRYIDDSAARYRPRSSGPRDTGVACSRGVVVVRVMSRDGTSRNNNFVAIAPSRARWSREETHVVLVVSRSWFLIAGCVCVGNKDLVGTHRRLYMWITGVGVV